MKISRAHRKGTPRSGITPRDLYTIVELRPNLSFEKKKKICRFGENFFCIFWGTGLLTAP